MISVIIPSYNRARTIVNSVQSVLQQTYSNIEVIVVDDGSTDDTADLLQKIDDKRLKYVYQENAGACAARNKGIQISKGEFIAFHDSDDIWHKDKLQKQIQKLDSIDADVVICKLNQIVDSRTKCKLPLHIKEGVINSNSNLSGIGTQTIFGKRSVFIEESFCGDMPRLQDLELMVRIVKKFKVYCIDEGLVDYYVGEDSISSNPEKLYAACNKMLELHPELENDNPETLNAIVNMLKDELKRDIISGGFNYLKFAGWIAHTQKSVKNLLIYVLTIIKIYPFFVSLFYKDKL